MIEISKRLKISLIDIKKIVYMVNKNEHKRRQAPICLMISEKVFEISRRWPVVASFNRNNL